MINRILSTGSVLLCPVYSDMLLSVTWPPRQTYYDRDDNCDGVGGFYTDEQDGFVSVEIRKGRLFSSTHTRARARECGRMHAFTYKYITHHIKELYALRIKYVCVWVGVYIIMYMITATIRANISVYTIGVFRMRQSSLEKLLSNFERNKINIMYTLYTSVCIVIANVNSTYSGILFQRFV